MKLKNLLYSSWVLYFIVFVVFFNIVGHALNGNYMVILFFILISFLTSFFSKNMIIVLVLGISISNLLFYGPNRFTTENMHQIEGFKSSGPDSPSPFDIDDLDEKEEKDADLKNFKLDKIDSSDNQEKLKKKIEEIKEVKNRMNDMNAKLPKSLDKSNLKEEEIGMLNKQFSDLLKFQEDVLKNVGNLEKSIQNVDSMVKDIRNNVDKIPKR